MPKKSVTELQFVHPRAPMATVEIDLDTLPPGTPGYASLVREALAPLAADDDALRATVYVFQGSSDNFQRHTRSAFFGVAGDRRALAALYAGFRREPGLRVRHSDHIVASQALCQYHVEDGALWHAHAGHEWYAEAVNDGDGGATASPLRQ